MASPLLNPFEKCVMKTFGLVRFVMVCAALVFAPPEAKSADTAPVPANLATTATAPAPASPDEPPLEKLSLAKVGLEFDEWGGGALHQRHRNGVRRAGVDGV